MTTPLMMSSGRRLAVCLIPAWLWLPAAAVSSADQPPRFFVENDGVLYGTGPLGAVTFGRGRVVLAPRESGRTITVRLGGDPEVQPRGEHPQGAVHYLLGSQPAAWKRNLPAYQEVVYRGLYQGIDLVYLARAAGPKSEYRLAAAADPDLIRWTYEGVDEVRSEPDGGLTLVAGASVLREHAPVAWQAGPEGRAEIQVTFRRNTDGSFGFAVGAHRRDLPLVIDPPVSFSTYYGGTRGDVATGVAVDSAGNAFVSGWTESTDFPLLVPRQPASGGGVDAFVAKFTAAGTLVYATYLGGVGEDRASAVAVDASGNAIVAGHTASTNFPTAAAAQGSNRGSKDGFVAKLNPSGASLVFSTFVGGSGSDLASAVAVDAAGAVYVAGETASTNFPVTASPYQPSNRGGSDAFAAKYTAAGAVAYSTYLGGSGNDRAFGIAVDSPGAAYLTGGTDSSNFPLAGAFQGTIGGAQDAFVSKLSASGSALEYSTYLGGNGGIVGYPETGNAIAVDSAGSAYVTGSTSSTNFPVLNPFQSSLTIGGLNAFLTKFSPSGNALVYSTYLGGTGQQIGRGIAVSATGTAYVAGSTTAPDFPMFTPVQATIAGPMNGFTAGLNAAGSALVLGTYLGGNSLDSANAIALDTGQNIYIAGQTQSTNFPTVNAIQSFAGVVDMFLTRLGAAVQPPSGSSVTPSSGSGTTQTFTLSYSNPQGFQDTAWAEVLFNTSQNAPGGCAVRFDRISGSLYLHLESGSGARGWAKPGSPGLVQNSMCRLDLANSSASMTGNTITLILGMRFKPAFRGALNVYLQSRGRSGLSSGWQAKGTWTVP